MESLTDFGRLKINKTLIVIHRSTQRIAKSCHKAYYIYVKSREKIIKFKETEQYKHNVHSLCLFSEKII